MKVKTHKIVVGLPKPRIKKGIFGLHYFCRVPNNVFIGRGDTPLEAYNDWIHNCRYDYEIRKVMRIVK
jgi:predicted alpha/beta hydrolase